MSILDFGMQMEKEGENFYKQNAEKCTDPNAVKLLLLLAYEETRHYQLIKTHKEGLNGPMYTPFLKKVTNVFKQMKETNQNFVKNNASIIDVLHKALEIEDKSIKLYAEQANKTEDKMLKDFFLKLKKEEDSHYFLISSWIEYYDRPNHWLEQAEFTKLEEY